MATGSTDLERLIEMYPNKEWDWVQLSNNPDITFEFILKHKDKKWNWDRVSQNINIKIQNVVDHPYLRWEMMRLAANPSITLQDVLNYPTPYGEEEWDPFSLSHNRSIPIQYLLSKEWDVDMQRISRRADLTLQIVLDHPDEEWDWGYLSSNPGITLQDIYDNPHLEWNWFLVSGRRGQSKKKQYKKLCEIIISLQIFTNEKIPLYLLMEIIDYMKGSFTVYELFHLIKWTRR